jgi:hypothetical protein
MPGSHDLIVSLSDTTVKEKDFQIGHVCIWFLIELLPFELPVFRTSDFRAIYLTSPPLLGPATIASVCPNGPGRFPEDFMFQLTKEEFGNLKYHFGTSSWDGTRKLMKPDEPKKKSIGFRRAPDQ